MDPQDLPIAGRCHCGNMELVFRTRSRAMDLPLRVCGCSFCVAHGGRYTSDPGGSVSFTFHDPGVLIRYRFGQRTADFLICGHCGVFMAAVTPAAAPALAVLNVNTFANAKTLTQEATTMDYEGEDKAGRTARRAARWTPVIETLWPS